MTGVFPGNQVRRILGCRVHSVTNFIVILCLLSLDYFCYRFIIVIDVLFLLSIVIELCLLSFYDLDFFLFLLSITDNDYAGFVYV